MTRTRTSRVFACDDRRKKEEEQRCEAKMSLYGDQCGASSSTPPPLPCAVVLGDNAEDLRRTGKVVKESLDLKRPQ